MNDEERKIEKETRRIRSKNAANSYGLSAKWLGTSWTRRMAERQHDVRYNHNAKCHIMAYI